MEVSARTRFLGWIAGNPLTAASLAGGLTYLLINESYRDALQPFGVTPPEVGIDYATAVWPVAQAALLLSVVFLFIWDPSARAAKQASLGRSLVVFVLLSGLGLGVAAVVSELQFKQAVLAGEPYEPFFSGRLSMLSGLRATRVDVAWKDAGRSEHPVLTGPLLLLGSANGTAVVFSSQSETTWRLPLGDVIITSKVRFAPSRFGGPPPVAPR